MQIILSLEESVAVTQAINLRLWSLNTIANDMPVEDTAWIDGQIVLLRGVIERTEGAAQREPETLRDALIALDEKERP